MKLSNYLSGLEPDVVLLDLTWFKDQTAGISAIKQIKSSVPKTKILVATVYSELIERARRAGADLAADKDSLYDKNTLAARIRDASRSDSFPLPGQLRSGESELSKREIEALQLIAQGETDRSIAIRLGISLPTVKKHVGSILSKLDVPNRAAAAVAGLKMGILTREDVVEKQ